MVRPVLAEWTKLRTLASTGWLVLGTVALTVGVSALTSATLDPDRCRLPCVPDIRMYSVYGVRLGQVLVVVLAVLAVSNEYTTRMIHATLTALPGRLLMLTGKVGTVVALVLATATVGVVGSLLVAVRAVPWSGFEPSNGYPVLSLADGDTLRVATGSVLYLGLIAVLSAGVALILRDTAGSITAVLAMLFVAPILTMVLSDPKWVHRVHRWAPMDAGTAVQATKPFSHTDIGPWQGLGVLAAYSGAALLLGALLFCRRDA
jgi:ABC-2 type transport system permease protein